MKNEPDFLKTENINSAWDFQKLLNKMSRDIHKDCIDRGWWDDPYRDIHNAIQLISCEIAEATEGCRKDLMDTHLPAFKNEEVEYADALIRTLDLGGRFRLDMMRTRHILTAVNSDTRLNEDCSVGNMHLAINSYIVKFAEAYDKYQITDRKKHLRRLNTAYSYLVYAIILLTELRGFYLWEAVYHKREYNKTRADHNRDNRQKAGGKSW